MWIKLFRVDSGCQLKGAIRPENEIQSVTSQLNADQKSDEVL